MLSFLQWLSLVAWSDLRRVLNMHWSDFYRFPINTAVTAYFIRKYNFGFFVWTARPHRGAFAAYSSPPRKKKNNDDCPTNARGDAHAWNWQSHNQYNIHLEGAMIKAWLHRFVAISSGDRCLSLKILLPFLLPLAAIRSLKLSVWTCGGKQDSACLL